MMNRLNGYILLLGALFILNGCGSQSIKSQRTQDEITAYRFFNSAARDDVVRMIVKGNPFAETDTATFEALVSKEFEGAYIGHQASFSTTVEPEFYTDARIVVYFQPTRNTNPLAICRSDHSPESAFEKETTELRAVAAFCVRQKARTRATVWAPMPQSISDPLMTDFIKTLTRNVIPTQTKDRDNRCVIPNC